MYHISSLSNIYKRSHFGLFMRSGIYNPVIPLSNNWVHKHHYPLHEVEHQENVFHNVHTVDDIDANRIEIFPLSSEIVCGKIGEEYRPVTTKDKYKDMKYIKGKKRNLL